MARLTRTLAISAVTALGLGTVGAVATPAHAGNGHGHGHGQHGNGALSLTRSAEATLDKFDVEVSWTKASERRRHNGDGVTRLRGSITFDGSGTDATWSKIRVNDRTNRVSAVVNGGERRAVLKFKDGRGDRHGKHGRTVLRLTAAGASSIDAAAGADAFDRGDAFAKAGKGGHRHR